MARIDGNGSYKNEKEALLMFNILLYGPLKKFFNCELHTPVLLNAQQKRNHDLCIFRSVVHVRVTKCAMSAFNKSVSV